MFTKNKRKKYTFWHFAEKKGSSSGNDITILLRGQLECGEEEDSSVKMQPAAVMPHPSQLKVLLQLPYAWERIKHNWKTYEWLQSKTTSSPCDSSSLLLKTWQNLGPKKIEERLSHLPWKLQPRWLSEDDPEAMINRYTEYVVAVCYTLLLRWIVLNERFFPLLFLRQGIRFGREDNTYRCWRLFDIQWWRSSLERRDIRSRVW